ncbi:TadE/TadG family type IV pilus assembly protein [Psychromonas hadalis]|uniref:TadE/TadG family type IV pilus assembly protein n=1 Tax=Psychromonas hadalis TaxID=211669 RepID=UPI0003B3D531|nr:TadE/TadG family type IV pilus assembly protein [Psychromonas hadalis]
MHKLKQKQQGLAAIEMTLVLPVLLLLLFPVVEFSRLLYQYNALTKVVRNASRYIVSNTGNIQMTANAFALYTYGDLNSSTPILPNLAATDFNISYVGEFVTVTASYPWQPIIATTLPSFVSSKSFDLSFPLVTTYTMRVMQ